MAELRILIPVLARPQNAQRVIDSIRMATVSPHAVTFICSPGDTDQIEAATATGADVVVVEWKPEKADFAKKINYAFDLYDEEWVFQAADDLLFSYKWDKNAIAEGVRRRVGVVGTNDLGNKQVQNGRHSTHTLIRRDYIDTYGGTVDGSGRVFSEAYDHQYTDNEFIQTAILRRQFSFSARAVVEHLHPHWGKAEMDSTYEKATRATQEDRQLYTQRIRMVNTRVTRMARQELRARRLPRQR